ncbi:MAG: SgcJ/EcaC family oxidoreductase [Candidatus Omnitrophica bacterium]|nr:SgcJ/EcaC family oxidoreductase [Candidatus Omnitrophota bacterium]
MIQKCWVLLLLTAFLIPGASADEEQDRAAIEAAIDKYVEAFNNKDAEGLASLWAENGDYMEATGRHVKGRDTIKSEYEAFFARAPEPSLSITLTSIYFASDGLVIEDGYREVGVSPSQPPSRIRYTAVHVKDGDQWFVQSVRDAVSFAPSAYEHLSVLEPAIGTWASEGEDGVVVESNHYWTDNKNFMIRDFTTSQSGVVLLTGTQRITWDPTSEQIISWHFDSNGSFGTATWNRIEPGHWKVVSETTLLSGQKVLQTHNVQLTDPNTSSWTTVERSIDGNPLPDTAPIEMKRQGF